MTPVALLERLTTLFPAFLAHWEASDNYFRPDHGLFTLHAVFSAFSQFFREHYSALPADCVAELGAFVSDCMSSADDGPLDNAAATCFVENIAGEFCGQVLSRHLRGEARRYWEFWGGKA